MISLVFAAALLAGAADPAAQASAAVPATATPAKAVKDDKAVDKTAMVCKREAALGSRMKQRVCMTQFEWDQRKTEARDDIEKTQSVKPLSF